jgi:hypothetical protein
MPGGRRKKNGTPVGVPFWKITMKATAAEPSLAGGSVSSGVVR